MEFDLVSGLIALFSYFIGIGTCYWLLNKKPKKIIEPLHVVKPKKMKVVHMKGKFDELETAPKEIADEIIKEK